jgi:hypothetical protein
MNMTETASTPTAMPTKRNALRTWLVPMLCFAAAPPLGHFLGTTAFRSAPSAAIICGLLITGGALLGMTRELNSVTGGKLVFWHLFIPVYGIYWAAVIVHGEMAKAKQKLGKPAPRSAVAYALLCLYAFAADLNDLA